MENAPPRDDNPSPAPSHATKFFAHQARLIMLKSNIAEVSLDKSKVCYIESGASHNFFNDKNLLDDIQKISPQSVNIAEGTSEIIAKGSVNLTNGINITMEAYFAPEFNSDIIFSYILSNFFEIHMTASTRKEKACILLKKGLLELNDVIWEMKCQNGLYVVQPKSLKKLFPLPLLNQW